MSRNSRGESPATDLARSLDAPTSHWCRIPVESSRLLIRSRWFSWARSIRALRLFYSHFGVFARSRASSTAAWPTLAGSVGWLVGWLVGRSVGRCIADDVTFLDRTIGPLVRGPSTDSAARLLHWTVRRTMNPVSVGVSEVGSGRAKLDPLSCSTHAGRCQRSACHGLVKT
jgi:hypothetical protein